MAERRINFRTRDGKQISEPQSEVSAVIMAPGETGVRLLMRNGTEYECVEGLEDIERQFQE